MVIVEKIVVILSSLVLLYFTFIIFKLRWQRFRQEVEAAQVTGEDEELDGDVEY